ncbi:hypothetical protein PsorP6_017330 [Peronosclerospora sorghi]|uniref:Uncharacterized protein n=1 Tax=Peronosclerospora sorghi TaxID=230839 RepID=A0ACC0WLX7_9STRA|nr:hypothetical protein PsorP6_017330 [Peronosclerospora sorghi]
MSTTPEAPQETPPQGQEREQSTAESTAESTEKQTQDTETEKVTEQVNTEEEKQETIEETREINADKGENATIPTTEPPTTQSSSKWKLDALPAASDEQEKTKNARNLETNTKKTPDAAKKRQKISDFSFARPTASSARRAAAITEKQTQAKPAAHSQAPTA